ncbi:MAG: type II toxin-antitoxin system VapC family toxin [Burkholderiaceae bacterium]|nr:type II toxin-antitoxin system VapC family toxin [Burkholderiaceae bacterium]
MGLTNSVVYPDTCILIYWLERNEAYADAIVQKLRPAQGLAPILVFTELTRLECRVKPLKTGNQIQLAGYDRVFSTPGYRFEALTREVFDLATELRAQHNLKTPDAIHLAAAVHAGCDEIWTNDDRLAKAAAGRIGVFNVKEPHGTNT